MQLVSALPLFLLGVQALPSLPERQWNPWPPESQSQAKAVYVMTNEVAGNNIVALRVGDDGTLSGGTMFSTGGVGSNYVNPTTGAALFPDALSSQDSLVQAGNYLFAVNAGSNTLSMLEISGDGTSLKLLGKPQSTQGSFPASIAVSTTMAMVCVGNTGFPSGISCASFSSEGLSAFDTLRSLDIGETSNPPAGPIPGIGDVFFSPDETELVVTVKGNPGKFTGYAATYAIENGRVGSTATQTVPPESAVLFGTSFISGSQTNVLVSDAGFGALILNLGDLSAEPIAVINVTGQKASCWAETSSYTGTGFITDAAVNRLVEVDLHSGAILTEYYPPNPFPGMTDFRIKGTDIWALSAGNGTTPASITTFDISGGRGSVKQVSTYAILGASVNTDGLAVF